MISIPTKGQELKPVVKRMLEKSLLDKLEREFKRTQCLSPEEIKKFRPVMERILERGYEIGHYSYSIRFYNYKRILEVNEKYDDGGHEGNWRGGRHANFSLTNEEFIQSLDELLEFGQTRIVGKDVKFHEWKELYWRYDNDRDHVTESSDTLSELIIEVEYKNHQLKIEF